MPVIRKKEKKEIGQISTSSLPDIVFMILFFFMVSTSMKET
ncbi:MAG: biopolymer transporter ExbD, partial [Tidjanibacter sp.]|nr:biopolymer transporter ExbD [Tidjanibacter sp.]